MSNLRSRGLIAAACVPFCAAVFAHWGAAAPGRIHNQPPLKPLTFTQYAVDYGRVLPRPVVQAHFDFTNTSHETVAITGFTPSCGCLNPQLYDDRRTYEPGEKGRFYVSVRTANERPGPHAYTVGVQYAGAARHEETVTFRLDLPERKVSVEPPEIAFYQLTGTPDERTIYVTDYRNRELKVLEATCASEYVSVEVQPMETDERGHKRTPIKLSVPGDVPPGRQIRVIRITTDDPEFAELHAVVILQGPESVRPVGFERPAD